MPGVVGGLWWSFLLTTARTADSGRREEENYGEDDEEVKVKINTYKNSMIIKLYLAYIIFHVSSI